MTGKSVNEGIVYLIVLLSLFTSTGGGLSGNNYVPDLKAIEINVESIQRERTPFTIYNHTRPAENLHWSWEIIDSETEKTVFTSNEFSPQLRLNEGAYDVVVTASGNTTLTRHFRRLITVLPKVFSERQADEVIDLSKVTTDFFVKDYKGKRRPGYKIMFKGTFNGRIKITGLRGTKKRPVHIINKGQVEMNAANKSPFALTISDNNQYVLIDGKADPAVPYGFVVRGNPEKSGQVLFIAGVKNRGFEICGVRIVGHQGKTYGAAAIQVQTAYAPESNADNWDFEYFRFHNNKIENASSEGMYIGYFTDERRDNGLVPYRMGKVLIYRDTILNSGWDAMQIASADHFEVHNNYVDGASLSGKRSHSSFISWNNGNKQGWLYRNTFKNSAHAANIFFGDSGREGYIYSNLLIEGTFPDKINTPGFFFSKLYNEKSDDVKLFIVHNTIITSRISAKIDYRNTRGNSGIPFVYAGNAILQNRINKKRYPEVALGSNLQDSVNWTINNAWRMEEHAHTLLWDVDYRPLTGSPLLNSGFDISRHIPKLMGGFYDHDGYPLRHPVYGYTYGCFSAYQIPDVNPITRDGIH